MNRLSFLLVAAVCAFSGCTSKGSGGGTKTSSKTPSVDPRNIPYEDKFDKYNEFYGEFDYDLRTLDGDDLKLEMHKYFIEAHKTYITYDNYWYYANTASDKIPGTNTNELFYTAQTSPSNTHENQDREHVWPCAASNGLWRRYNAATPIADEHNIDKTGTFKYWGAGSDLFHVRPATSRVNQQRSDAAFYEFSSAERSSAIKLSDGGPYSCYVNSAKNKFEVDDHFKGDVARIIMYLWVHYTAMGEFNVYYSPEHTPVYTLDEAINEEGHSPNVCGQLSLRNVLAYDDEVSCHNKLVEWNRLDPPSQVELNRNNYVQSVQGNRNPFIDYPQLVEKILFR